MNAPTMSPTRLSRPLAVVVAILVTTILVVRTPGELSRIVAM